MSCGSTTCSQSQTLPISALAFARPSFLDIRWRDRFRAGWMGFLRLQERRRQRLALADLDDRLLADIGISPAQARREASKPFWAWEIGQ